jgi:hypothetical protein
MALKGLAVLMGKGSGDEQDSSPESDPKLEDEHLTDAFDAVNKGDRRAFLSSMKAAIRACMAAEEADEYGDESAEKETE